MLLNHEGHHRHPFFPRSSLLHKRLGAMKSPDLVKKFHHAGDLNRTPAILVSSAFFFILCVLIFPATKVNGLKTFRSVNFEPNLTKITLTIVVEAVAVEALATPASMMIIYVSLCFSVWHNIRQIIRNVVCVSFLS